jgi:hypothetical protein
MHVDSDRDFALDGCVTGDGGSVADLDDEALLHGFGEAGS